jgi:hypothetical protein
MFFLLQVPLLGSYLQIEMTLPSGMSISRDSILFKDGHVENSVIHQFF